MELFKNFTQRERQTDAQMSQLNVYVEICHFDEAGHEQVKLTVPLAEYSADREALKR
ncbi:hypothetical protein [uncultured Lentibacter sp.]|jgi:hypothetical protein|uniref:hypothetical protein n=1 Tax=uncultured Lentibacter sp. TaxID=1659309 RepID=UPI002617A043|nr:hypothetical protein [uncultured Lentibacter sp.]